MEILSIAVNEINLAEYNPRKDLKPGDPEYDKLKKSILEFDIVEPLVWNKQTGNLVGGHQRLKILKELGIDKVEVSVVDLSPVKEKALNIALNKIQGEWDFLRLKDLLQELDTGDFDIEITGFDESEIENLMTQFHVAEEGLTDDDAIPEQVETVCKTGDLWQLGNHRLLCGDATKKEDVERLMGGEKADLVVTSPPYWIGKEYERQITNEQIDQFVMSSSLTLVNSMIEDGRIVINVGVQRRHLAVGGNIEVRINLDDWQNNFRPHGWLMRHVRCWVKTGALSGTSPLGDTIDQNWEFVATFYNANGKKRGQNRVGESWAMQGIWDDIPHTKQDIHPAPFSVELPNRVVKLHCALEGIVYDPFGGSGSTLIACEKLGRRCFMMEIDEHYNDVIITRWMNFIGKEAIREDGKSWNQLLKEGYD